MFINDFSDKYHEYWYVIKNQGYYPQSLYSGIGLKPSATLGKLQKNFPEYSQFSDREINDTFPDF